MRLKAAVEGRETARDRRDLRLDGMAAMEVNGRASCDFHSPLRIRTIGSRHCMQTLCHCCESKLNLARLADRRWPNNVHIMDIRTPRCG